MADSRRIVISGGSDSRNNGCWAMVAVVLDELTAASPVPLHFVILSKKGAKERSRFEHPNVQVQNIPWSLLNIPKTDKLLRIFCLCFLPVQALLGRILKTKRKLFFNAFWQTILGADLLIDVSGDTISEDYGWLSVASAMLPLFLARLSGVRYFLCAQSIGPFGKKFTYKLATAILKDANFITPREHITYEFLKSVGVIQNNVQTADLAFLLPPCSNERVKEICRIESIDPKKEWVGISISALIGKYAFKDLSSEEQHEAYIKAMAELADHLVSEYHLNILFIPHVTIPGQSDDRVCVKDVVARMKMADHTAMPANIYNAKELKGLIKLCRIFIGSRMHAAIGALSQTIPTITYVYNHKTLGVIGEMLGQKEFLLDIRNIQPEDLLPMSKEFATRLLQKENMVRQKLAETLPRVQEKARHNIQIALGLLEVAPPLQHMEDVRFCTGCGTCCAACKVQALVMAPTVDGTYRPRLVIDKCTNCKLCLSVCPVVKGLKIEDQERARFNIEPKFPELGVIEECFAGYAIDGVIRYKSSSGGLISAINKYILKTGKVDAVLNVTNDPVNPTVPMARWISEETAIEECMGSKYIPIALNVAFDRVPNGASRVAIVGLPCHIWGLHMYEKCGLFKEIEVVYRLGLFCGMTPSLHALNFILDQNAIQNSQVRKVKYRGDGWPGGLQISTHEGAFKIPLKRIWPDIFGSPWFYPHHCMRCPDFTAHLSDISFGDAWLPKYQGDDKGWSLCLARSPHGTALLDEMKKANLLYLESVAIKDVLAAFKGNIKEKRIFKAAKDTVFKNKYPVFATNIGNVSVKQCWGMKVRTIQAQIGISNFLTGKLLSYPLNTFMKISNKITSILLR